MSTTYEGLFILNTTGKEEGSKELIEKVEKDIQAAGGKISKVERMDKRPFARVIGELDSGYYVNIVFSIEPKGLKTLDSKFKLDEDVYRVLFMRPSKIQRKAPAEAAA